LLAALTGLSSGATMAMIDRLAHRKLIARRPNPHDRRGSIVVLTTLAKETLPALFKSLAEAKQEVASGYTESELAVIADFFAKTASVWTVERDRLKAIGRANP
jgi:DNA-binding MarR family transcriptional regulator